MKFKRNERIGGIVKILSDSPNRIFTLSYFTQKFNAAKSTISEDILIVKNVFEKLNLGKVITIAGAAGGVKYIPKVSSEDAREFLSELCEQINDPERVLPGKFLYLIDIIYSPQVVSKVGKLFATYIDYSAADCVVTIETKGIPLALATANAMNLPLVIIRKNSKISEGSSLSINYASASNEKIQTMSLSRKSLKEGSKVILIDDFMRGGGTLKGMQDLMKEFKADVVGKGVLISTNAPEKKLVEGCISLMKLVTIETGLVETVPNDEIIN
ncbi:MAG: pur operon repressor [Peptoclostridium sp.]|jgi:pur operon repressor, Bacillus subtilis type|uniref:pur operon repressor n=1 Tax=Peptoclostridium sp. TaxID=1904860 RepID=UPI00139C3B8A|nr:pur operon repressor [Peptoclostridium sp.]MZQ74974.1 pur operon repressor [Peptoclostridium sp.]